MTKKIEKKVTRSPPTQKLSALWPCFMMFVVGYLAASWFDVNECVSWVTAKFKNHSHPEQMVAKKSTEALPKEAPHPKLEFYTLLSSDSDPHVSEQSKTSELATDRARYKTIPEKTSNPVPELAQAQPMELAVIAPSAPAAVAVQPLNKRTEPRSASVTEQLKSGYGIQVGSFRSLTEAKKMRDTLTTTGYSATVSPVIQQSTYWYRVIVGPFPSLVQTQQGQMMLSNREHIHGMIRKIEG